MIPVIVWISFDFHAVAVAEEDLCVFVEKNNSHTSNHMSCRRSRKTLVRYINQIAIVVLWSLIHGTLL